MLVLGRGQRAEGRACSNVLLKAAFPAAADMLIRQLSPTVRSASGIYLSTVISIPHISASFIRIYCQMPSQSLNALHLLHVPNPSAR